MKILIKNIEPNPFRNLEKYPINKERVAKLKGSIKGLKFWGGIVCREHPTKKAKYQLAFGHHRLQALRELKYTEISMKVLKYDDSDMLLSMAEENRDVGQLDIKTMLNLIEQTMKFLDNIIEKYETWGKAKSSYKFIRAFGNTQNKASFGTLKDKGTGRDSILKFLNKNKTKWSSNEIDLALSILKDENIDREAVTEFEKPYQAKEFKKAINKEKVPKEKQKEVAEKVIKEIKHRKKKREKGIPVGGRAIKDIVKNIVEPKNNTKTCKAERLIENIAKSANRLLTDIDELQSVLTELKVTELKGLKVYEAYEAVQLLIRHFEVFGKEY